VLVLYVMGINGFVFGPHSVPISICLQQIYLSMGSRLK